MATSASGVSVSHLSPRRDLEMSQEGLGGGVLYSLQHGPGNFFCERLESTCF